MACARDGPGGELPADAGYSLRSSSRCVQSRGDGVPDPDKTADSGEPSLDS